jgi:hypothetical protein
MSFTWVTGGTSHPRNRNYILRDVQKNVPFSERFWSPSKLIFSRYGKATSSGIKRAGREADYSFRSIAEFKNDWTYNATHPHALWTCAETNIPISNHTLWCFHMYFNIVFTQTQLFCLHMWCIWHRWQFMPINAFAAFISYFAYDVKQQLYTKIISTRF